MKKLLLFSVLAAVPMFATSPCPTAINSPSSAYLSTGGCNVVITFAADGSASTTITNPNPYDGTEDTLVGVLNNSASTITSFNLSGSNIFGFDSDGACSGYVSTTDCAGATGYAGPGVTFSLTNSNNGTVSFSPGIGPNGGTAWFSLEEPPTVDLRVTQASVPEPGTIMLLGTALAGFGVFARRRQKKS